jgi:hypothetical protein
MSKHRLEYLFLLIHLKNISNIFHAGINGWIPTKRETPYSDFLAHIDSNADKLSQQNPPLQKTTSLPPPPPAIPVKKPSTKPTEEKIFDLTPAQEKTELYKQLRKNQDFPKEIPIQQTIGKFGLMWPRKLALDHQAKQLLSSYAEHGCPVDCGPNWTRNHIELALQRGPHVSAKQKHAARQLQIETNDKIKHGYARIVKWKNIKDNIPEKLKISPIAMIPHKSRKFRAILDLSFNLFHKGMKHPSVNEETKHQSKHESMAQLGLTIKRIIATMAKNIDHTRPFKFSKIDIKDGFWRMAVNNENAWNFCYVLPQSKSSQNIDEIEIVVPNSLQMGWCESPPFFCASSETARDVIDKLLTQKTDLPKHRFEEHMVPQPSKTTTTETNDHSTTLIEVFVDDFIGMTNDITTKNLTKISRAMIHGVHSVFPPPEISGHNGHDPVSLAKLIKGEGAWEYRKEVLGWILDGQTFTLQLPESKCKAITLLIKKITKCKRISLNKFQKLTGKLQHASFGIPGGTSLFSPLQRAMASNPDFVNITNELIIILTDWRYMIQFLHKHPTSVLQLTVELPNYIGYSDSCGIGTGGVWTSGTSSLAPLLWQLEWPQDIQENLVTATNKSGTITMNDLELAGAVLNWLVLECQQDLNLQHKHIGVFCDNTSAVSWAYKLRTSKSIVAGRLLRMLGMRIHARQASSLTPLNIAGDDNTMADIASRAFKHGQYFEASKNLTSFFNSTFPLPQKQSWNEFQIPKELASRVISCLRGELLPMASLLRLPKIAANTGPTGNSTPRSAKSIPSSPIQPSLNATSSSQPSLQGCGRELTAEAIKSKFRASRMRSHPSPRPSNWLENQAPCIGRRTSTTSHCKDSSKVSGGKIPPQSLN